MEVADYLRFVPNRLARSVGASVVQKVLVSVDVPNRNAIFEMGIVNDGKHRGPLSILLADDDPDDRMLTMRALKRSRLANDLHTVSDGVELMQYLRREGEYADPEKAPWPGLILLDLNMPRKDGREALREIKSDPKLRRIPVVVLTTSEAELDILRSYDLGVNAFITKPVTFDDLANAIRRLGEFWFEIVKLPNSSD